MKFGRNRPIAPCPKLSLSNYLLKSLPPAPDAVDYADKPKTILADVLNNDVEGCCTISGVFHLAGLFLANAGVPVPPAFNKDNVHLLYRSLSGGEDTGLDEQTVLNYWKQHGMFPETLWDQLIFWHKKVQDNHKIEGWMAVDATNAEEVKTAMWLFENLYFGVELPDEWVKPMPGNDGFVWDVAGPPNPKQGHCYVGVGYNKYGVRIDTWGLLGYNSFEAVAKYAATPQGSLYVVLSPDSISKATGKAPNGFDFTQLQADLQAVK